MPVGFPDYYGGLTLPVTVAEGGTGQTSVTSKALLYGAGTSKLIETNVGTSGQYLQIDPVTLDPTFEDLVVNVSAITGILAIAHGGTGTASPGLVAGTSISITGTWPNQTIANTSNYASLADPLPVAHGGTGTATPALTGGTNITVGGTWPAQSISTVVSPSFTNITAAITFLNTSTSFIQIGVAGTNRANAVQFANASGNAGATQFSAIGAYTNTQQGISAALLGIADVGYNVLVTFDLSGNMGLAGTLFQKPLAQADITGRTSTIGSTTLLTPGAAGMYRVSVSAYITPASGGSNLSVTISWTQHGTGFANVPVNKSTVVTVDEGFGSVILYADASTNIQYSTTYSISGSGGSYDLHVRLEKI